MSKLLNNIEELYKKKLYKKENKDGVYLEWGKDIYHNITDEEKKRLEKSRKEIANSKIIHKTSYDRDSVEDKPLKNTNTLDILNILSKYREARKKLQEALNINPELTEAKNLIEQINKECNIPPPKANISSKKSS